MSHRTPQAITLVALILVAAVANLNLAVANVALPDIGEAFDSSQTALNLVAVGYSLGLAASVLYLGAVGDRYGRKLLLVLGVVLSVPGVPARRVGAVDRGPGRRPAARRALRRDGLPDDPGADHRAVVGPAADQVHRAVVGARWRHLLARPADLRRPARALLVGLGVPHHPAAGRRRAAHGAAVRARPRQRDDRARRPPRRRSSRSSSSPRLVLAINFAPVPDEGAVAPDSPSSRWPPGWPSSSGSGGRPSPLYDLHVAARRVFWVAACAGIIVFGTLMGAMFIGQQFLQNVLGYSTVEAGAAILPAAIIMVLIAPRSAKLVEAKGARFTLLVGYVFCLPASSRCSCCGTRVPPTGRWASATRSSAPASASPAPPPPTRSPARCRSRGPAWRRAPPTCSATSAAPSCSRSSARCSRPATPRPSARPIAADPDADQISDSVQSQLTKSFAGAEGIAEQYPQYASQITAAAKTSFLDGADWAYAAGIVAILLGAALVFSLFPKRDDEARTARRVPAGGHRPRRRHELRIQGRGDGTRTHDPLLAKQL